MTDLDRAEQAYRDACRASNRSLGQNSRTEILDLVEVRDKAYTYIHQLEIHLMREAL